MMCNSIEFSRMKESELLDATMVVDLVFPSVIAADKSDDLTYFQDKRFRSKRNMLSVKNGLLFWRDKIRCPKEITYPIPSRTPHQSCYNGENDSVST
ncbi:unnamed protein product [Lepeophtheirus salmonis]|uniref:(salmon louse) hypothetical protein n=1 Tax=Lepeophtheirus salmonis TaxID=72036 RepID=A0A7R8CNS3_LEPSM|nr:unnamed protein product [Lepeophtheirus salmonis]CAF2844085.1 unnamed protein product [Lepeophtheirus salmonis]